MNNSATPTYVGFYHLPFQVAAFSVSFAVRRFLEVLVEKGIC